MTLVPLLDLDTDPRRADLIARRRAGANITGIDYLEVSPDQVDLAVYFIDVESRLPVGLIGQPSRIRVVGGNRVAVRVTDISAGTSPAGRAHIVVTVDQPGDFSDYTLEIDELPELDEYFRRCVFNFKVDCPTRFDCCPPEPYDLPEAPGIEIDYMAKDYASFRQALVDLISRLSPQWTERLPADLGMTVLELLAYAADQLSYYQDAVANEAFLETARQRISVRRHARLVDYEMHDGASARTLLHFTMMDSQSAFVDSEHEAPLELLTRITTPIGAQVPGMRIRPYDRDQAVGLADAVFETFSSGRLDWRLNQIALHDWGSDACVVPAGATSVDLVGDFTALLKQGDLLLLEEVIDPRTGDPGLADPAHRQVVRLSQHSEVVLDNLQSLSLTRVTWHEADALRFPLWVTASGRRGATLRGLSVARGNLLLADHGMRVKEPGVVDAIASGTRAKRFTLQQGPLSFRLPPPDTRGPAANMFAAEPLGALAQVTRLSVEGPVTSDDWKPQKTLIRSDRFDHHFAVETNNDGRAQLRFGDDVNGMAPPSGQFEVEYRVGLGMDGNVGADTIAHVIDAPHVPAIEAIRNPLGAWGGLEPESETHVKRVAPAAFRASRNRAVTEADYAEVAERHVQVRAAVARFRWTGSWYTVFISIDPEGRIGLPPELRRETKQHVETFTQAGYDLEIVEPHYVPLEIALEVCVAPAHFRADVESAIRLALRSGRRGGGKLGFFHADNFSFGQPLYVSSLYAAVAAVEGVESVVARRFARLRDLDRATAANLQRGELQIGPLEILRLDDDANFPENGLLRIDLQGGK